MGTGEHEVAAPLRIAFRVLTATRPWSFSMTVVSVALGTLAAGARGHIDWWLGLLTLAGTLCLHAATNLANDYFDYRDGIDTPDAPGVRARHHPLVESTLRPRQVMAGALAFWAMAALIATGLGIARGWVLIAFTGVGVLAGYSYSARPFLLKAKALGELTAFLMWGPLMVLGAFFVQRMTFQGTRQAVYLSVVQGAWVALVLLANNLRDRDGDAARNIHTPATLAGPEAGRALEVLLCAAAYVLIVVSVLRGVLAVQALLVVLSGPSAVRFLVSLYAPGGVPADAPARAAKTALAFGSLLIASQVISLARPA